MPRFDVAKERESDVAPNRLLAALLHRSRFDSACDSPLEFILAFSLQCRWDVGPNRFWTSVLHRSRFDSACVFRRIDSGHVQKMPVGCWVESFPDFCVSSFDAHEGHYSWWLIFTSAYVGLKPRLVDGTDSVPHCQHS